MENNKLNYKLTNNTIMCNGVRLYQIEAITNFNGIKKGTLGGYIESTDNLSDNGWVGDNAKVYGDAHVGGNAKVYGNVRVFENACVLGDAWVGDNAMVYGDAHVGGKARVGDDARVFGDARVYGDAIVGGYAWVCGDAIATGSVFNINCIYNLTLTDNHIMYGCIQKTIEEWKQFLKSDEVIQTPRDTDKFKRIVNKLEFVIKKHELELT